MKEIICASPLVERLATTFFFPAESPIWDSAFILNQLCSDRAKNKSTGNLFFAVV
jgi:hypothetical protein